MTARSEIERQHNSLDSRLRPMYQKRSTSLSQLRYSPGVDIEMQTTSVPTVAPTSRRQKSVSVCIAALQTPPAPEAPRTIEQYEKMTMRDGFPQTLSAFELCHVRLPALSTSEVFNEQPGMYVYRERPVTYPYMRPKQKWSLVAFFKSHKHTIVAWTFGIVAITAVMVIIIIQTVGDAG